MSEAPSQMGRLCSHTHFTKGKRLYVRLRDGSTFYDRFVQREGRFVTFEIRGRVRTRDIDVIGIAKGGRRGWDLDSQIA